MSKFSPAVKPDHSRARTEAQIVRDLGILAADYLRGLPLADILEKINANKDGYQITIETLRVDLEALRAEWLRSAVMSFDEAKAKELAHIDELERAYWEGWLESRLDKISTSSEAIEDLYGKVKVEENRLREKMGLPPRPTLPQEAENAEVKTNDTYSRRRSTSKTEGRIGDPRFLKGVSECIEMRAKIFGLYEPAKFQVSWKQEAAKAGVPESVANQEFEAMVKNLTKHLNEQYDQALEEGRDPDMELPLPEPEEDD